MGDLLLLDLLLQLKLLPMNQRFPRLFTISCDGSFACYMSYLRLKYNHTFLLQRVLCLHCGCWPLRGVAVHAAVRSTGPIQICAILRHGGIPVTASAGELQGTGIAASLSLIQYHSNVWLNLSRSPPHVSIKARSDFSRQGNIPEKPIGVVTAMRAPAHRKSGSLSQYQ